MSLSQAATFALILVSAASAQAQTPGPITAEQKAIIEAVPHDPEPEELGATREDLKGRHYLSGDEAHLELFYPKIKDIGGIYTGVGSDQAYLLMGWQKADFAFQTDYDPWIRWLHLAYMAFFDKAEDIEQFRAFWLQKNRKTSIEHLEAFYADHPEKAKIVYVFKNAQHKAAVRLRRLQRWMDEYKIPSFVTDKAQYDFVRAMIKSGRVRPMLCNLLDKNCFIGIADASRKLNTPVRVVYTSNAEQYWPFGDQYRANIKAQNFDDKSVILRTLASKNVNSDYAYNLQPGNNFKLWLEKDWVKRVKQIPGRYGFKDETDVPFIVTDIDPDAARAQREKK